MKGCAFTLVVIHTQTETVSIIMNWKDMEGISYGLIKWHLGITAEKYEHPYSGWPVS
jgi:hypothetical protein